ncbi:hypothetical protein BUALT_Bualt15G0047200 [Buddleja alternifolia]|uniref:Uncharacterized protein n=1 Tax=Buddleja alternifolia TaxID=168488 RepID=A0AAV6WN85_9LAMI|nr:hypothetical protein BUALT_Bualt15G0047200 [Buddleja alternifolia]
MRKMSGQVVSTRRVSLSRAAILMSRFAAVDNGSSPTVSIYLQRAAEAFTHLADFHDSLKKSRKLEGDDLKSDDGDKGDKKRRRTESKGQRKKTRVD